MARVEKVVKISLQELDRVKQNRNGVVEIPRKHLEEKAKALADQGEWVPFIDTFTLLIFGVVLFPNMEGLVDLAVIDAFLAYHHNKESPTITILADLYDTFDRRCKKSGARIVCCMPALYVWLVSHLFLQESRPTCPLQGHRLCTEKGKAKWEQHVASVVGASINWFPRWKEGKVGVLSSCEGFSNVPLMGTRGCINYNLVLAIRQLGYPMRGAPSEESIMPFIAQGFSDPNARVLQGV